MAKKNLTEKMVERLPFIDSNENAVRYFDRQFPNLVLKIGAKTKTFYWLGRNRDGEQIQVKLGVYPNLNLEEAREESRRIAGVIRKGFDPRKGGGEVTTGKSLVDWLVSQPTWKTDRTAERANILEGYLRGEFVKQCGDMNVSEIHSGHMLDILDIYQQSGRPAAASHMWCALSILWQSAILRRIIHMNPLFGIKTPKPGAPRDRVLSEKELTQIWDALGSSAQQPAEHAAAIRLLMLLPFRGVELIHGRWSEIDFEAANWTIARDRIKTRSSGAGPFLMPLPPISLGLLKSLHETSGNQHYLFPAPRAKNGPIDVRVIGRFISRNIQNGIFKGMQRWTKHDLRRTVATNLGALKVDERVIARCLNHKQAGVTTKFYNLYGYREEKYEALRLWQDYLMGVVGYERNGRQKYLST